MNLRGGSLSPRRRASVRKLAMMVNGEIQTGALKADVEAAIAKHRIDLVVIDPLKKAHGVDENDNTARDYVVSLLVEMASNTTVQSTPPITRPKVPQTLVMPTGDAAEALTKTAPG